MANRLTFAGQTLPLAEWAGRSGLSAKTLQTRVRLGWPPAEALLTPVGVRRESRRVPRPCPALRFHPGTGQAFSAWKVRGRRLWAYHGPWGTRKAAAMYRAFQRRWAAGWRGTPAGTTHGTPAGTTTCPTVFPPPAVVGCVLLAATKSDVYPDPIPLLRANR